MVSHNEKTFSHTKTLAFKILLLKLGFMSGVSGVPENLFLFFWRTFFCCTSLKVVYSLLMWWTSGLLEPSLVLESDKLGLQSRLEQDRIQTNRAPQAVWAQHSIPAETLAHLPRSRILALALSLTGMWHWASYNSISEQVIILFLFHIGIKASLPRHYINSMK